MKLLALETAAEACSVALSIDGEIHLRYEVRPRGHSELVLAMMDELLNEVGLVPQQLDAMAIGRGPGSFTGVRIATGVVQGVAFAADLPVVPVSTLAALAQRACRESGAKRLLPAFDARMGEVYWAVYRLGAVGLVELDGREAVAKAGDVNLPDGDGWYGVGTGWAVYGELLAERMGTGLEEQMPDLYCSAEDVALLGVAGFEAGGAVAPELALPIYLRDRVANKKTG
ncbi:MAG: tRNA (adenosine(37)-N6)-threonylcarbamoyltransferase complex dimerization subunit type 1 TsaB [gamma proteobacterium endosymbiont of Lamellibrachia anaximandri]|nr:tRNA (adenosine(37)-N6)-threonylcarbamoyltransferase complex dimerization subunit type 1 TsaB [gamma proteobacterium endosymbiont of Lamellibrachia anaximandri]